MRSSTSSKVSLASGSAPARPVRRIVLLAIVLGAFLAGCVTLEESVRTPPRTNVTYRSADGTSLVGYRALPPDLPAEQRLPAVIMIHEWWGFNEETVIMAEILAAEGFVVLAPDALRGELATSVPQAIGLSRRTPPEQIAADLDGALAFLRADPRVDPDRIAVMGFCFGGREAMRLGIRAERLAAVVTLYGSGLVTDPAALGNMAANGPVLGIFGEDDGSIPLREVDAFGAALAEVGAEHTISIYPEMGHAFVKSDALGEPGAPAEAWSEVVAFLSATLEPESGAGDGAGTTGSGARIAP